MALRIFLIAFLLLSTGTARAEAELPRRGFLGVRAEYKPDRPAGARILRIAKGSPADAAGWQVGDTITEVDGQAVTSAEETDHVTRRPVAGRQVVYRLQRDAKGFETALNLAGAPVETYREATLSYGALALPDGRRVRTLFSRPNGVGRGPALLVVGWLSAASIEAPDTATDGSSLVFRGLIEKSGMAVLRIEKPGVGDSEGVLANTDFATELAAYRAGLAWLRQQPSVDPARLFILGTSNGGGIAPLVAGSIPICGYVVEGAWARTWYEHMLDIERRRLTLFGHTPGEVSDQMRQVARLHSQFLLDGRTPAEIFAHDPQAAELWPDRTPATLYGRPPAFYQQLQALNLADAWSHVTAPTLVLHGEFDWVMGRVESELIIDCVNRAAPGRAELLTLPQRGHTFSGYASLADAFADRETPFDPTVIDQLVGWLQRHNSPGNTNDGTKTN